MRGPCAKRTVFFVGGGREDLAMVDGKLD